MEVDVIVGGTCYGEDKLEKTSNRWDTSWALICLFVLNDHFDLIFEMMITWFDAWNYQTFLS